MQKIPDGKDLNAHRKTPDEIKKSLERCGQNAECSKCAYYKKHDILYACMDSLLTDALTIIEQLERERDAAIIELRSYGCEQCVHSDLKNIATICRNCELGSLWEWQGVKEEKNNG